MRERPAEEGPSVLLAAVLSSALSALLSLPALASPVWPNAYVVVFERRTPAEIVSQAPSGDALAALRRRVTDLLAGRQGPLRKGDHLFAFADGMTPGTVAILTRGNEPSAAGPEFDAGRRVPFAACRAVPDAFLRLPGGGGTPGFVRNTSGVELAHIVYDGNPGTFDCFLRRSVTAPLSGEVGSVATPCPEEGRAIEKSQSWGVSRVELTYAAQLRASLSALGPEVPISRIFLVRALLYPKNFDRDSVRTGLLQDFGRTVGDCLSSLHAAMEERFPLEGIRSAGVPGLIGPRVELLEVQSASTRRAERALTENPEFLSVSMGGAAIPHAGLHVVRNSWTRRWSPRVDSMTVKLAADSRVPGDLLAVAASISGLDGNVFSFPLEKRNAKEWEGSYPDLERAFREAQARGDERTNVRIDLDLVLKGRPGDDALEFTLPRAIRISRTLVLAAPPLSPVEWASLSLAMLFAAAFVVTPLYRRTVRFQTSERIRLEVRQGAPCSEQITLYASTGWLDLRLFPMPVFVRIAGEFLLPPGVPVVDARKRPLRLAAGATPVPLVTASWTETPALTGRVRPGSPRSPMPLEGLGLTVALEPGALDVKRMMRAGEFPGLLQLDVEADSGRRFPRVSPFRSRFFVPVLLDFPESAARPFARLDIDRTVRRLGVERDVCENFVEVADLVLTNSPEDERPGEILRPVDVAVKLLLDSDVDPSLQGVTAYLRPVETERIEPEIGRDELRSWRLERSTLLSGGKLVARIGLRFGEGAQPSRATVVSGRVVVTWGGADRTKEDELPFLISLLPPEARRFSLDLGGASLRGYVEDSNPHEPPVPLVFKGGARELPWADGVCFPKVALGGREGEQRAARAEAETLLAQVGPAFLEACGGKDSREVRLAVAVPWTWGSRTLAWLRAVLVARFGVGVVHFVRDSEALFHALLEEPSFLGGRHAATGPSAVLVADFGRTVWSYSAFWIDVDARGFLREARLVGYSWVPNDALATCPELTGDYLKRHVSEPLVKLRAAVAPSADLASEYGPFIPLRAVVLNGRAHPDEKLRKFVRAAIPILFNDEIQPRGGREPSGIDLGHEVARGAWSLFRNSAFVEDMENTVTRDLCLCMRGAGNVEVKSLLRTGERIAGPRTLAFRMANGTSIDEAWVLRGFPSLNVRALEDSLNNLVRGPEPPDGSELVVKGRPQGNREVRLRIEGDEEVAFAS